MTRSGISAVLLGTGTSQGVPVIGCDCNVCLSADSRDKRLRTSALVTNGETTVSIDIGPDFRQQMLRSGTKHVDAVLLTHEHNDHVNGIDDIRPINFRSRKHIPIFGMPRALKEIKRRFAYAFDDDEDYPGRPRLDLVPVEPGSFMVGSLAVEAIGVMHGPLPILGFRFGGLAYITDCKSIDPGEMKRLAGLDILVINALHRRPHFSHLNLDEAVDLIQAINPRLAYLTHISHDMGMHADVERELPDNIRLGYDGLRLEV